MTRHRTLTWRVLVILALAAVVPTVVVGALAIRRARADLEREVVRGNLALIRALGGALDATLQDARRALELAAAGWADRRGAAAPVDDADARATARLLGRMRRQVSIVSSLSIVDPDGVLVAGDPVPAGVDPGFHSFGGYIGDAVFVDGHPVVPMAVQARSRTGELVAVLVARLDLTFVGEALAAARLGAGARIVVVDGAGIPVARSDGAPVGGASLRGASPAVDRALASSADGSVSAGGEIAVYRNLSSYQSLRGVRWAIVLAQPEDQAYALAEQTAHDTALVGAATLALALLVGAFLAARLTRPLSALADRADAIAGGDPGGGPPSPVAAPGEIGVLARRIDEMARRIGERAELQAALARGDRLATVGVMSAQVAHEINNPLTTVLGYARLLVEDKPADHPDRAGLELIADEAERMKGIVGGLLDYARAPKEGGAGPADVDVVARHVAALLGPQLRRARIAVELAVADALPAVAADPHALQQVLLNLVQNAAHAMPDGGRVEVVAERGPGDVAVVVGVRDQGPGVPAADRQRIFDPFVTSKEAGAGTGLGLAVCKHLVATWGGAIEVGDAPGGGAELRFTVPVA